MSWHSQEYVRRGQTKFVRLVDVIDGNNGDGDPIVSYETPEELARLIDFVDNQSDGRYQVEDDVYMSTVDAWIENEKRQLEEWRAFSEFS
jgi:hypothetical protein